MSNASGTGEPFIFEIPVMRMRRNILLGFMAVFLLVDFSISLMVGFSHFYHALKAHPALWLIEIEMAAGIALYLRLAYPPRSTRPRLEIKHDSIRYIPDKSRRWSGEPTSEVPITPRSDEILLTRDLLDGLSDGHRLIVSAAGKVEHEFKIDFFTHINAQQARQIADGITSTTGLPVRLIQPRNRSAGSRKSPGFRLHEKPISRYQPR